MRILEKILEEIEHETTTNKEIGRKQYEGMCRGFINVPNFGTTNKNAP